MGSTRTATSHAASQLRPGATIVCRHCREPVTVQGAPRWGKAVHLATGKEQGPGGHVAAPIEASLIRAAAALKGGAGS
jgi:hypothetical protein